MNTTRKFPAGMFALFIVLVALGAGLWWALTSLRQDAPRFSSMKPQSSASGVSYGFLEPRPFESGKMWIATDREVLVYDLEKKQALGNVTNGWPVLLFGERPQLLCYQPTTMPKGLQQVLLSLVARLSGGRVKLPPSLAGHRYWLLDLRSNTPRLVGDLPGTPNTLFPSPDFHYCITTRFGQHGPERYLLDLPKRFVQKLDTPSLAWTSDWWDNTRLLCRATNLDFVLYDVSSNIIFPLLSFQKVAAFLRENGIVEDSKQAQVFAIWNGHENDFYLTDTHQKWLADESFLIKLERPDGKMKLLFPRFKFEWSDHIDSIGRWYLYSGRESGQSSDGVFVRDLVTGTNRVLVPATTNRYFSIPRFYRDSVVYIRSNALWQIGLDGLNNVRLFPGSDAGEPRRK